MRIKYRPACLCRLRTGSGMLPGIHDESLPYMEDFRQPSHTSVCLQLWDISSPCHRPTWQARSEEHAGNTCQPVWCGRIRGGGHEPCQAPKRQCSPCRNSSYSVCYTIGRYECKDDPLPVPLPVSRIPWICQSRDIPGPSMLSCGGDMDRTQNTRELPLRD